MKIIRKEILPGVAVNCLQSDKFKSACLSVMMLTQLTKETASLDALVPFVLRRGTAHYVDMEAISNRLDELYGAVIVPSVRRVGEIHATGLYSTFLEDSFLPGDESVLKDVISLISEMLISPATKGGLLIRDYVDSERDKLADIIRSRINEKRTYAVARAMEECCCFEDLAAGRLGSAEDCASINYKKLTHHYHDMLSTAPVEIFYCGQESANKVSALFREALVTMPRGEINYDIGTDVRMNAVEETPRYYEEHLDVTQGKLVMAYRLGECMEEPDIPAIMVFNTVYGSGVTSKLFNNVREKLSLCYYASSSLDKVKGLMIVNSGIEFDKFDVAKAEIEHQLDEVRKGEITDDELKWAKAGIQSDLSALLDNQFDMEGFYFTNIVEGADYSPEELSYLVGEVTKEDVMSIASSVELDLVYFLRNGVSEDDD